MDTAPRWNASCSRVIAAQVGPKWREVRQGLLLAALGSLFYLLCTLPGLALRDLAPRADRLGWLPPGLEADRVQFAGILLASVAIPVGYGLLLAGLWRCLMHAPQRQRAREWMLLCLLCLLVGSFMLTAAHFSGGLANYGPVFRGPEALDEVNLLAAATLLQLGAVAFLLLGSLLFNHFLRILRNCLDEGSPSQGTNAYFFIVFLLVGASVGDCLPIAPLESRQLLFWGLALGWLAAWVWHVVLVLGTRRYIRTTLRRLGAGTGQVGLLRLDGRNRIKGRSGLRHAQKAPPQANGDSRR
jgi:hypothetical protein